MANAGTLLSATAPHKLAAAATGGNPTCLKVGGLATMLGELKIYRSRQT